MHKTNPPIVVTPTRDILPLNDQPSKHVSAIYGRPVTTAFSEPIFHTPEMRAYLEKWVSFLKSSREPLASTSVSTRSFITGRSSSGTSVVVEDSAVAPSPAVFLNPKDFRGAYRRQLDGILEHGGLEGRIVSVPGLVSLYEKILTHGTLQLRSAKYVRRLPQITEVLNSFFFANQVRLSVISLYPQDADSADQHQQVTTP